MRPALDSAGHRVPRTKPTCLLHTWRPHRWRHFALVLHLHQHQSSRNLHLQYLAKSQFTQLCQSLITPRSNHPPVLKPHMVLNFCFWFRPPHYHVMSFCSFISCCTLFHIVLHPCIFCMMHIISKTFFVKNKKTHLSLNLPIKPHITQANKKGDRLMSSQQSLFLSLSN
jgi:hypothetical protein